MKKIIVIFTARKTVPSLSFGACPRCSSPRGMIIVCVCDSSWTRTSASVSARLYSGLVFRQFNKFIGELLKPPDRCYTEKKFVIFRRLLT